MNTRSPSSPPSAPGRLGRVRQAGTFLAGTILAATLGVAFPAYACRYNVRDVGFVDLEGDAYHFYWYLPTTVDRTTRARLEGASSDAFENANFRVEWIGGDADRTQPEWAHRPTAAPESVPCGSLVSPDGQTLPLLLDEPTLASPSALRARLEDLVTSPLRETLVSAALQSFGAILIIEGTEDAANRLARRTVDEAIEAIGKHMKSLPKAIASPPTAIVLDLASQAREQVLLWSLGIASPPAPEPRAAVVYGRARWIGPLMEAGEISVRNLSGIFSIIGADCECGLDLSWTQGTRLPIRWHDPLHERAAQALGFDPENPVVKNEVTWIVSRQSSPRADSTPPPARAATPSSTSPDTSPTESSSTAVPSFPSPAVRPATGPSPSPSSPPTTPSSEPTSSAPLPRAMALGMAFATLMAGIWLWIRARGR